MTARKYGNKKVHLEGMTFDSLAEFRRWGNLKLLERAGHITHLQRQVPYVLCPPVRMGSAQRMKPAVRLIVDFQYRDEKTGETVLEDTKGIVTDIFRLKAHLLKAQYGLEVKLTK